MGTLQVVGFWLALSIPLGPAPTPQPITLDGSIILQAAWPAPGIEQTATSTPFGYWLNTSQPEAHTPQVISEELHHMRQMEALGPAFWLAYGLTCGEPFESYPRKCWRAPSYVGDWSDPRRMWQPDERRFGQVRVEFGHDTTKVIIMPGYAELLGIKIEERR